MTWTVRFIGQARQTLKKGSRYLSQDVFDMMESLYYDLEKTGPNRPNWPGYGKLKNQGKGVDKRHCHLIKGKPTYVVCWEVKDPKNKILEVYYVGTHEKAPY
jgi:hypothetical protein